MTPLSLPILDRLVYTLSGTRMVVGHLVPKVLRNPSQLTSILSLYGKIHLCQVNEASYLIDFSNLRSQQIGRVLCRAPRG